MISMQDTNPLCLDYRHSRSEGIQVLEQFAIYPCRAGDFSVRL